MASAADTAPTLARKIGLKPGMRIALVGPPAGFVDLLGLDAAAALEIAETPDSDLDAAVLFARTAAELEAAFPLLALQLNPAGMLWVAWPKKSSGVRTDLVFDVVQSVGLRGGLVDTKICAIDDTWSGLKFVRRLRDRQAAPAGAAVRTTP